MERFVARKLSGAQIPRKVFTYYATGRGVFPFDMLRYDAAWPYNSTAAAEIDNQDRQLRSIQLCSYREPTIERWSSFGWSVGIHNLTEKET